jgi:hypothetical protein
LKDARQIDVYIARSDAVTVAVTLARKVEPKEGTEP